VVVGKKGVVCGVVMSLEVHSAGWGAVVGSQEGGKVRVVVECGCVVWWSSRFWCDGVVLR
jgi:hypothetical protein